MLEQSISVLPDGDRWRVSRGGETLSYAASREDALAIATDLAQQADGAVGVMIEDREGEIESQQYIGHDALPWGDRAPEPEPETETSVDDPLQAILEHAMPVADPKSR